MTDTWAEQEARRIAHELDFNAPLGAHHYGIIATALRRAEDRGLERAAVYADASMAVDWSKPEGEEVSDIPQRLAKRIRALKSSNAP